MDAEQLRLAFNRAFALGQAYWQQADSDSLAQHRRSDETSKKFEALRDETVAATFAPGVQGTLNDREKDHG